MSATRIVFHLARADFLERVRRYSFLMTMGAAVFLGYQVLIGNVKMQAGHYAGAANSAWLGSQMAICAALFVSLVGFYIVKNTIERDRQTRVGQILASTPMSKPLYTIGKVISNFVVFAAIVAVLVLATIAMQLWRNEQFPLDLAQLLLPFLLITLPGLAFISAIAVLFETLPGFRGGFGNVAWFFVWTALLVAPIESKTNWADISGISILHNALKTEVSARFPDYKGGFSIGGSDEVLKQTFVWDGLHWTLKMIVQRLAWYGAAFLLAMVAAGFFDRFDPARGWRLRRKEKPAASPPESAGKEANGKIAGEELVAGAHVHLTPIAQAASRSRFLGVLIAEIRLMLKGQRWIWYAGVIGFWIASIASPLDKARAIVLPLAWLWPVLLWSAMGTREAKHETGQLIFSSARALTRQLPAVWLAGALLSVCTGGIVCLRLLLAGESGGVLAWIAGALFIPSLALALGVWSGTSKLFEGLFTVMWYIGPMNRVPDFDYCGATRAAVSAGMPIKYLVATALLVTAAFVGRRRQVRG